MSFKEVLYDVFIDIRDYEVEENFNMFKIYLNSTSISKLDSSFFNTLSKFINTRDNIFSLTISLNENDAIYYNDIPESFIEEFNNELTFIKNIKTINFKLEVTKNKVYSYLSIYNLNAFSNYLSKLKLSEFIYSLHSITDKKYIYFELQENNPNFISYTNLICFKSIDATFEKTFDSYTEVISKRKSVSNLLNDDNFDFEPDNFAFSHSISDKIDLIFNKLIVIYSLISIFDVSNIKENILHLKLNGYKNSNFDVNYNNINISKTMYYYDIYKWIYEEGTISDKVGISRNIISLYLVNSVNIDIDNTALTAIKSNFNIYLRDNVEKYLDLKSKIVESLFTINKSINEISSTMTDNFIKNLGLIGTFIFTAIIMNSFSEKRLYNIFTKDISFISLFLILCSILFLIYTIKEIKYKKINLIETYCRLKNSYKDLLVKKDIDDLFKNDRYIRKDLYMVNKKLKFYSLLWSLALLFFLLIVLSLGFENIF